MNRIDLTIALAHGLSRAAVATIGDDRRTLNTAASFMNASDGAVGNADFDVDRWLRNAARAANARGEHIAATVLVAMAYTAEDLEGRTARHAVFAEAGTR